MISATFDKAEIDAALDAEFKGLSSRVRLATELAGRELLRDPLRGMTAAALQSRKLPTTWRAKVYPNEGEATLSPAYFVSSKAPKIMAAFEEGPTIRPFGGRKYLWIPTENVPRGQGGRRLNPREVAAHVGKFTFRPLRNGGFIALAAAKIARVRSHRTGANRNGRAGALHFKSAKKGETSPTLAFFVLKPQVRLRKRLDIAGIAEKAGATYKIRYERAANAS